MSLIFMDPCIVVWLSRNNQQDATFVWGKDGMWTRTKFACQLLAISNLIHQIVLNMTYTQTVASNCVITDYFTHFLQRTFRRLTTTQVALQVPNACYRNHPVTDWHHNPHYIRWFFDRVYKCYSSILWIHVAI
jgi:hypothetical protein